MAWRGLFCTDQSDAAVLGGDRGRGSLRLVSCLGPQATTTKQQNRTDTESSGIGRETGRAAGLLDEVHE